jgi:hypothetical protein
MFKVFVFIIIGFFYIQQSGCWLSAQSGTKQSGTMFVEETKRPPHQIRQPTSPNTPVRGPIASPINGSPVSIPSNDDNDNDNDDVFTAEGLLFIAAIFGLAFFVIFVAVAFMIKCINWRRKKRERDILQSEEARVLLNGPIN